MADDTLLGNLRAHLAGQGIVRVPQVAGAAPPLWLEPGGLPAPGDGTATERGTDAVLGAYIIGGSPSGPYEGWLRRPAVEIRYRVSFAPRAVELERQLYAELVDRRNWQMANLRVIESEEWNPFGRLGSGRDGSGFVFDFRSSYVFQLYAA
jgi:hypothetical protein